MDTEVLNRFDKMDDKLQTVNDRILGIESGLEKRIIKIENYFNIVLGIALILGISAGVLGTMLVSAKKTINVLEIKVKEVQKSVSAAQIDLEKVKTEAIAAITSAGDEIIRTFPQKVDSQIPNVLRKPFDEWLKEERNARFNLTRWLFFIFKEAESYGLPKNSEYANGGWQQILIEYAELAKKQLGISDVSSTLKKELKPN